VWLGSNISLVYHYQVVHWLRFPLFFKRMRVLCEEAASESSHFYDGNYFWTTLFVIVIRP